MSTKDDDNADAARRRAFRLSIAESALMRWDGVDAASFIARLVRRWNEGPEVLERAAALLEARAARAARTNGEAVMANGEPPPF